MLKGQCCSIQLCFVVLAHAVKGLNCLLISFVEYSCQIFFKMMPVQRLSTVRTDVASLILILIMSVSNPVAILQPFQQGSIRGVTDTNNAATKEFINIVSKLQMGRLIFRHSRA